MAWRQPLGGCAAWRRIAYQHIRNIGVMGKHRENIDSAENMTA
jgi:hypothetical protein